jgi:hypothetical protein
MLSVVVLSVVLLSATEPLQMCQCSLNNVITFSALSTAHENEISVNSFVMKFKTVLQPKKPIETNVLSFPFKTMYSKFFIRKPKGFKGAMTFGRVAIKREAKTVYDSKTLKFLFYYVILLNVILFNVILLNVILLNGILLNGILLNVILLNVILPNVILLNVILLNVILLNVILLNAILLNANLLNVILLNVILLIVILWTVIVLIVILLNVILLCHSAEYLFAKCLSLECDSAE